MWEFSIGLILLELRPDSLALVAFFGLVDSLAQVIAGPYIGAYVDRYIRLLSWCFDLECTSKAKHLNLLALINAYSSLP